MKGIWQNRNRAIMVRISFSHVWSSNFKLLSADNSCQQTRAVSRQQLSADNSCQQTQQTRASAEEINNGSPTVDDSGVT